MNTWEDVLAGRSRWSLENRDSFELAKLIPPGSIDHTIEDRPYDKKTHERAFSMKGGGSKININFDYITASDISTFIPRLLLITRRWVLQFCTQEMARDYQVASQDDLYSRDQDDENYIRAQWWVRTNGVPQISGDRPGVPGETIATLHSHLWEKKRWNAGGERGVYTGPRCSDEENIGHPTQKPEWLMRQIIERHTDVNDLVFDGCSGVATTGKVCIELGRRFIGCELKGPCPTCGGGYPSSWDGVMRKKVLAIAPDLIECKHDHTNYYAIGLGRLRRAERSPRPQDLFSSTTFKQVKLFG